MGLPRFPSCMLVSFATPPFLHPSSPPSSPSSFPIPDLLPISATEIIPRRAAIAYVGTMWRLHCKRLGLGLGKGSKVKGIIESRLTFFFSHTEGVNVYVPVSPESLQQVSKQPVWEQHEAGPLQIGW